MKIDSELILMLGGVITLLSLASLLGFILKKKITSVAGRETIDNLIARVNAWWGMTLVFMLAIGSGGVGSVILFGVMSFLAFREFITLTPTHRGDHRTLFWSFFIIIPVHYLLVGFNNYGVFSIFIPIYAFLFIPIRNALAADNRNFLARTAKIQWALMITVYCVSHAPALLGLNIPGYELQNAKLLFFFV
ncbi:MAG: phosphatidate cytidylyltransferase, partial [Verrucomicrobiota bacterium]